MSSRSQRQFSRRSVLKSAGVIGGLASLPIGASLFAGCGDDDGTGKTPAVGQSPATAASAAAETPKRGGTLRYRDLYGGRVDIPSTDPYAGAGAVLTELLSFTNNGLLRYDHGPKVGSLDYTVTSHLAKTLPEQPDQTTFIFKLRDQLKWENAAPTNGRAITADDIKVNFERALKDPGTAAAFLQRFEVFDAPHPVPASPFVRWF